MRVGFLSDIHGYWTSYEDTYRPDIELLIISGDLCRSDDIERQEKELLDFFKEFIHTSFPKAERVVIVPGNHDFWIEKFQESEPKLKEILGANVEVLVDRLYEHQGVIIYGNPHTALPNWAFGREEKGSGDIQSIPEGIDILVTHEAPRCLKLECIQVGMRWYDAGSERLYFQSLKVRPKVHVFGHIHVPCELVEDSIHFICASQMKGHDHFINIVHVDLE